MLEKLVIPSVVHTWNSDIPQCMSVIKHNPGTRLLKSFLLETNDYGTTGEQTQGLSAALLLAVWQLRLKAPGGHQFHQAFPSCEGHGAPRSRASSSIRHSTKDPQ